MSATVIIPTTGAPELKGAIESVLDQTYKDTICYVVIDGLEYRIKTESLIDKYLNYSNFKYTQLPINVGAKGFYGHRIYAAFTHLINTDYVLYLDQDNWFYDLHVQHCVDTIEKRNLDWCYSLRKIHKKNGEFACFDDCESLGRWPAWVNNEAHLIDSSSYCFSLNFLRAVGHIWDYGWGADRRFYTILKDQIKHNNYGCTGLATLNYRLGGNEGSVTGDFFIEGNKKMEEKYAGKYPWRQQLK